MRRLALLAVFVLLNLAACKHKPSSSLASGGGGADVKVTDAPAAQNLVELSVLKMADPAAEPQLVRGFYGVESGSWRWTASKFAVKLRPPEGSAQSGATLQFQFSLPDVIVNKVGPVTLSVSVNGTALASQTYSKSGEYVYTAAVPAAALSAGTVTAEFATNKAMPPANGDKRELALVAVSVGLSTSLSK
jgi:hypothetical protein